MSGRYELLPHQKIGAAFLAERSVALLLDEPGAGKSAQAVAAADLVKAKRVLVLSPALVRNHWANTFEHQQDIERPIHVIDTPNSAVPKTATSVTIMSHAALVSNKRIWSLDDADPFDVIITDEAAEFRRFEASRTRNLLGDDGLWCRGKHNWFLTGTPIVNSAADLYPIIYGPLRQVYGEAPSWWDYCRVYAELRPDGRDGWKAVGVKDPERLADMFRPFTLRRTLPSAGITLPELTIERRTVELPPDSLATILADLSGWSPTKLQDLLNNQDEIKDAQMSRVRRALGIAKAPAVAEKILTGNLPVVVFFQHTDVKEIIGQYLADRGLKVAYIDGNISRTQLTGAVNWMQNGALDVLLVQTQAGGTGLTLTRANRVVVAELPWTHMALSQAIARVHRYTQTRPVTAEIMQATGVWLDDVMASVVQRKQIAAQRFLDLLTVGDSR